MRLVGILLLLATAVVAEKGRSVNTVFEGAVNVRAGQAHTIRVNIDSATRRPKLVGYAEARGAANDVRMLVFADNGQRLLFDSGAQRSPRLNLEIKESGEYQVVLNGGNSQRIVFAVVSLEQSAEAAQPVASDTAKR